MTQEDENLSENEPNINSMDESRSKSYRLTMEFPLFFTMLSMSLSGAAISNLILYRTCVHSLNHTQQECQVFLSPVKNNGSQALEEEVQKYATFVSMVRTIIESVAPAILSLFLGVWSDRHGRKPLVVWPLLGMTVSGALIVVYSMLESLGPWWFILTAIPVSLSGGFTAMFTGSFCYVSDISAREKRSLRMTIVEASVSAGSVTGAILSSYLLRAVGSVYLLVICTGLSAIAYLFTNVFLKESLVGAVQGGISSVLDFKLIKEMLRTCFKRRPNHGRAQILLLTIANSLSVFILFGNMSLQYMYTRQKLHWAIKQYTLYSAVHTTVSFFGSFFGVMIVQKLFKVTDLTFSTIAYVSDTIEYVIITFATVSWQMYAAAGISLFRGLSSPLIRSLLTKILPPEDIAKVFALMCAIEGISPLISPALYNSLYAYTISTFPGAIYMLSTGISCVCVIFLGFVQYYRWKECSITYNTLTSES
ncbi:probable peptidoglycan muropeptide transporter SLC46 [Danaus plexippus]|uniref:probable peptidoglycan muropeptide transporter SLC46 n=1 Tax=Danaus plexippus TaxID=13037 RepID=UPI002AB09D7B|nr:probable peptidoglycan muropeptide transporter SLC46 [Danaus plexippus]